MRNPSHATLSGMLRAEKYRLLLSNRRQILLRESSCVYSPKQLCVIRTTTVCGSLFGFGEANFLLYGIGKVPPEQMG